MNVTRHRQAAQFLAVTRSFLEDCEAEYNLPLGLALDIASGSDSCESPLFWSVSAGERVVGAALRTPPHNIVITRMPNDALAALCERVVASDPDVPGVTGPAESADEFASQLCRESGRSKQLRMDQRLYVCDAVIDPKPVPGVFRVARESDAGLAASWIRGFFDHTGNDVERDFEREARNRIAEGSLFLWEEGSPVSMAGTNGVTPTGIRVSLVYTPPELRGRGFASACVAALTRRQLDSGRRWCMLYTDLANPTSNSIYQKIGYRPIGDSRMWSLQGRT